MAAAKRKKMAAPKKAARRRGKSAGQPGLKVMVISLALGGLLIAALPTALLILVGLTPSLVALIVDVSPGRYLTRCVAGMNLAGIAPFVYQLWSGINDMSSSLRIIGDPFSWLAIYGAAGIGWLLFLGLPGIVQVVQTLNADRRINVLRERQAELLSEWGDSIRPKAKTAENT